MSDFTRLALDRKELLEQNAKNLAHFDETTAQQVRQFNFTCQGCKTVSELHTTAFIQDHWYTSPSSCNDGDRWNRNETKSCHILCLTCRHSNYLYNHPDRDVLVQMIDDLGLSKNRIFDRVFESYDRKNFRQVHPKEPEPVDV